MDINYLHYSSFEIGFSQFACMKSDTSDRVFLTLEVSSGWQEVRMSCC